MKNLYLIWAFFRNENLRHTTVFRCLVRLIQAIDRLIVTAHARFDTLPLIITENVTFITGTGL